jgi:hypothetical protein
MRRLTKEQREMRSGRGIPINRWSAFALAFVAALIASADLSMLERCAGRFADGRGRTGAWVRFALTYPCSPSLLRGSWSEWLLFSAMWVPLPFAVLNWFWLKRHRAYWDGIRRREKEGRAEKRSRQAERTEAR